MFGLLRGVVLKEERVTVKKTDDDFILLPCPFCGSEDVHCSTISGGDYPDSYEVCCNNCTQLADTRKEAINAWNARAQEA